MEGFARNVSFKERLRSSYEAALLAELRHEPPVALQGLMLQS